jgi:hypothetical protein
MVRWVVLALAFIAGVFLAECLDNGLGRRPPMGYNTWNDYYCNVSEASITAAADAIVLQGLDKVDLSLRFGLRAYLLSS